MYLMRRGGSLTERQWLIADLNSSPFQLNYTPANMCITSVSNRHITAYVCQACMILQWRNNSWQLQMTRTSHVLYNDDVTLGNRDKRPVSSKSNLVVSSLDRCSRSTKRKRLCKIPAVGQRRQSVGRSSTRSVPSTVYVLTRRNIKQLPFKEYTCSSGCWWFRLMKSPVEVSAVWIAMQKNCVSWTFTSAVRVVQSFVLRALLG